MEEQTQRQLIYCTGLRSAPQPLYRYDPEGRGIWLWCRGHHQEELQTWKKLGLTKEALVALLCEELGLIENMSGS